VAEGAFSKGISLLADETKLAPVSPETIAALQGLHPSGISLPARPALRRPFQDDELKPKQLLKSLRSFEPFSAPGPSGLRAMHLREAFDVPCLDAKHDLQELLLKWVETSVTGELPSWSGPWLASAKLVPLRKPGGGLRPVAVGETLRRLSSKVLQQVYSSRLASSLAPLQLGVAVRGAAEQIGRKLHRLLAEDQVGRSSGLISQMCLPLLTEQPSTTAGKKVLPAIFAFLHFRSPREFLL